MQTLNAVIFIVFLGLIVTGAARTTYRVFEYRRDGQTLPQLLKRDVISRNGLALSFGLILLARTVDADTISLRDQLWWVLLTSTPALLGAAVYCYYEYFVIDKRL